MGTTPLSSQVPARDPIINRIRIDGIAELMLFTILSERGYDIKTVDNVFDWLSLLKQENFSVIISDLQLPDMDGLSFFIKIKNLHIPFIILTAFGSIEIAVKAMKEGATDFVSKPVDPDYLCLIIEKALKSTKILRENLVLKEEVALGIILSLGVDFILIPSLNLKSLS